LFFVNENFQTGEERSCLGQQDNTQVLKSV
jgi:hypothetical protein